MTEISEFFHVIADQDFPHIVKDIIYLLILDVFRLPVLAIILYFVVRRAHKKEVSNTDDNKHISFSLNDIQDGMLELTSISPNTDIKELFQNTFVQGAVLASTKNATRENPLLVFPERLEKHITGTFQNVIQKSGIQQAFRGAAGFRTYKKWFVFMAAYELYEDTPLRKVRVIVTSLDLLNSLPENDNDVTPEEPHQIRRLTTMRKIRDRFNAMPEHQQRRHMVRVRFDCHEKDL